MKVVITKITLFLKKGQAKLFMLSLLYVLAILLIGVSCLMLPLAGVSLSLVLHAGYKTVMLSSYKHKIWNTDDMFAGFKQFRHICFGMLWTYFKAFIWAFIPGGIIISVYKLYQYRFVPYILFSKKDVKATDAPEISAKATCGYKGYLFALDLLVWGAVLIVEGIFFALSFIEPLRNVFLAIMIVFGIAVLIVMPFIKGITDAVIYAETSAEHLVPQRKTLTCPSCKNKMSGNAHYCSRCGEKMVI